MTGQRQEEDHVRHVSADSPACPETTTSRSFLFGKLGTIGSRGASHSDPSPLRLFITDLAATPHLRPPIIGITLTAWASLALLVMTGASLWSWMALAGLYSTFGWFCLRQADTRDIAALAWRVYGLLGGVLLILLVVASADRRDIIVLATGLSVPCAVMLGIRIHRPTQLLQWHLLTIGSAIMVAAHGLWIVYSLLQERSSPYPSPIDAVYLTGLIIVAGALALIVRSHAVTRERGTLIDASIVATSTGVLAWVFLMVPYVHGAQLSAIHQLTSVAYLLVDVLLIAVAMRMLLTQAVQTTAYHLISLSLVAILAGDIVYSRAIVTDGYVGAHTNGITWVVTFLAWGLAALHPTMTHLSAPAPKAHGTLDGRRVVLLATASLVVPAALAVQALRGEVISAPIIAGGSAVLFLLVVMRLNGLIATHRSALARESTLRATAASLVASTSRADICAVALEAAASMTTGDCIVAISSTMQSAGESFPVVAATTPHATRSIHLLDLPKAARIDLIMLRSATIDATESTVTGQRLGLQDDPETIVIVPITIQDMLVGMIVTGSGRLPREAVAGIESLASQVALALESHHLTVELSERRSEDRFRALVRHSSDIITIIAADGTIRYASPSVQHMLDHDAELLTGEDVRSFVHADDHDIVNAFIANMLRHPHASFSAGYRMRHRSGAWRDIEAVGNSLIDDPAIGGIVVNARDVSERKQAEAMLAHRAFHDTLTGLPNRTLFLDRVAHALARSARRRESIAVLFLDLDRFKQVNDSFGHDMGDELLVAASQRILACLRQGDTGARLGGDEFTVLLEDVVQPEDAITIARRIIDQFTRPFHLGSHDVMVSTSIGIAFSTSNHVAPSDLLREADMAMYQAKARGKATYAIFDAEMGAHVIERIELETRLRRAIEQNELRVSYQPQMDLTSGRICSFEALVRWDPPDEAPVPPDVFIPLAEETGLILQLGQWVLEQACRQAMIWQRQFPASPPCVGVNLSDRQFQHHGLIDDVKSVLEMTGLQPANLLLEITESGLMEAGEANIVTLRALKELGVRLAIDDFGIGFSNLSYLKHFPVDILKIDRSFVQRLGQNPEDTAIVAAINTLAHTLGMRVTAEGIETAGQYTQLVDLGCDQGQGYLFAHALDPHAATELLKRSLAGGYQAADFLLNLSDRTDLTLLPPPYAPEYSNISEFRSASGS